MGFGTTDVYKLGDIIAIINAEDNHTFLHRITSDDEVMIKKILTKYGLDDAHVAGVIGDMREELRNENISGCNLKRTIADIAGRVHKLWFPLQKEWNADGTWITGDAGSQFTSSLNPTPASLDDWYGNWCHDSVKEDDYEPDFVHYIVPSIYHCNCCGKLHPDNTYTVSGACGHMVHTKKNPTCEGYNAESCIVCGQDPSMKQLSTQIARC
jgi:hypothetical protein